VPKMQVAHAELADLRRIQHLRPIMPIIALVADGGVGGRHSRSGLVHVLARFLSGKASVAIEHHFEFCMSSIYI
jgi:hypothetical protein